MTWSDCDHRLIATVIRLFFGDLDPFTAHKLSSLMEGQLVPGMSRFGGSEAPRPFNAR
jgi:hypothetical protein